MTERPRQEWYTVPMEDLRGNPVIVINRIVNQQDATRAKAKAQSAMAPLPVNPHAPEFLAKCEAFLLHPTVRALSLAQRVDFLERKGLSPVEITHCLQSVERQNGLARLVVDTAASSTAAGDASTSIVKSGGAAAVLAVRNRGAGWWTFVLRYGVAASATLMLAYGYVRMRERMVAQMLDAQREHAAKKRAQRQGMVETMLASVSEQRQQYEQVIARVRDRLTRHTLRAAAALQSHTQLSTREAEAARIRDAELRTLQAQVRQLKATVLAVHEASVSQAREASTPISVPTEAVQAVSVPPDGDQSAQAEAQEEAQGINSSPPAKSHATGLLERRPPSAHNAWSSSTSMDAISIEDNDTHAVTKPARGMIAA